MNGFNIRIKKAGELQNEVIRYLDENKIAYILSGYEYLKDSNKGAVNIKSLNDKTSLFIRHYPDISLIYPGESCLLEIKNSTGIEKHCYENYLGLSKDLGLTVCLYLQNNMICDINELVLKPMNEHDYVANMNVPVIDGVWKCPRSLPIDKYNYFKNAYANKGKNTSGSTFAFIDFENTPFYPRDILITKKYPINRAI